MMQGAMLLMSCALPFARCPGAQRRAAEDPNTSNGCSAAHIYYDMLFSSSHMLATHSIVGDSPERSSI